MVKIKPKASFASLPPTQRATSLVLGGDPNGKNFLYTSGTAVVMRDIENPQFNDTYNEHKKPPVCAKYSPSGFYICSGDTSGMVHIWPADTEDHMTKYEYQKLGGKIMDIAWDADSKRIAICGDARDQYGAAFLWDSGSSVGKIDAIQKSCNSVDIKKTRPYRLAMGSEDFKTYLFEGPPFRLKKEFEEGTRFCNCVRYSPDGKYLASANSDGNIYLLDGKTSEYIGKFGEKSHGGGVYSICFSPDSSELMSASADKSVKIWNVESREQIVQFVVGKDIEDQQLGCLWQGDNLISVSLSGEINYFDRDDPSKPKRVVTGHNKSIVCCATKLNDCIFSASFDGRLVKWNPVSGEGTRFKGKGHGSKICCMLYDAENNKVVTCGMDNSVRFTCADSCDFGTSKTISLDSEPTSCAFTSDGGVMVACEKEVVLIKDCNKVFSHPWQAEHPCKIAVCGSTLFASGERAEHCTTQTCETYEIGCSSVKKANKKISLNKLLSAAAGNKDGSRVALADGKEILYYDLADGMEKDPKTLHGHSQSVTSLAWSPNGEYLASGSTDSVVFVWDPAKGSSAKYTRSHPKAMVTSVAWLDDNTIVSVSDNCFVCQWTVTF